MKRRRELGYDYYLIKLILVLPAWLRNYVLCHALDKVSGAIALIIVLLKYI